MNCASTLPSRVGKYLRSMWIRDCCQPPAARPVASRRPAPDRSLGPQRRPLRSLHPGAGKPGDPVPKSHVINRHWRGQSYVEVPDAPVRRLSRDGARDDPGARLCRVRAAKARGTVLGRPRRVFRRDEAIRLRAQGMSWRNVAKTLNLPMSMIIDACSEIPPTDRRRLFRLPSDGL
jgi:hypothetical protein